MNACIPTIFRSYHSANSPVANCPIWQALRASTAHPEMFESMSIEEFGISQPYVDAAMGCSNPIEHVLAEAKKIYPNRRVACIVSIGGGHARTIQIPDSNTLIRVFPTNAITAMRDIATDNEKTAQAMANRFQAIPNLYFRLNVDQGTQTMKFGDWDRLSEVIAHTRAYISKVQTKELVKRASSSVKNRIGAVPMKYIDGEIQLDITAQPSGIKECPTPTSVYTERPEPIQRAIGCLADNSQERRVFVFHGLGGAGKTQLALRTVQQTRDQWSDVVYVDDNSTETLRSTLGGFAVARKIGKTHEDTIRWLSLSTAPWLMVFDNADDPSIGLPQYFPKGAQGRILITTRARELVLLSQGPNSEYNVSSMEPDEALQLLLTVSRINVVGTSMSEKDSAALLVQDLGYMALAVVQAGAYIWRTSCDFTQYRHMYSMKPRQILERYNSSLLELSGYEKTVYGTWILSYELLSQRAQKMLWLVAYLQPDRITVDIFRLAATRSIDIGTDILPTDSIRQSLAAIKEYLSSFLTGGEWDIEGFLSVMKEIMSYSLISYDRVNATYSLHVLVQKWVQTVIPYSSDEALLQSSLLLLMAIDRKEDSRSRVFRRSLELHIDGLRRYQTSALKYVAREFGYIMQEIGRYSEAKTLQLQALELYEQFLPIDSEETLWLRSELADTYRYLGSYKEGESIQVQVLETRKRILGDKHPHTLSTMSNLANAYWYQGLHKQAEILQVKVLESSKQALGSEHPHTLAAMSNLSLIYWDQGLYNQAEVLQVQVAKTMKRILGNGHPSTLDAMNNLANTYTRQGRHKQAETLQLQVLEERKQVLGDEHPRTLTAINNLAITYWDQGLYEQAKVLQIQVLEGRKRLLGDEHPHTLNALCNLANTYRYLGLYKKGETIQVWVLEARKRALGDEHPHTLTAMSNLANTYSNQGLHNQAETLQVHVLETIRRVLGDEHPNTLTVMRGLAIMYSSQGQWHKAESLEVKVVEVVRRLFDARHPQTLGALENLANTYRHLGWSRRRKYRALKAEIEALGPSKEPRRSRLRGLLPF
ncbi:kinesin light chain [Ceratobasidium sp. AG-Ba]|nr:kinesin light chain [Ceratobasidium sp. AG-Ba]